MGCSASHSPRVRSACSAARPYGACSGLAIAKRGTWPRASSPARPSKSLTRHERRARRREQDDAPDGVQDAGVTGSARAGQLLDELLVGRQEQGEGGAVLDLTGERPRGSEDQFDALASVRRELVRHLRERELEVRRGGHPWR